MNPKPSPSSSHEHPSLFPKCPSFLFLPVLLLTALILLQLQSLKPSLTLTSSYPPSVSPSYISKLRRSVAFLPLKDLRLSGNPFAGNTWFMSSLSDTPATSIGDPSYIRFPSAAADNRLLCVSASDPHDGSRNSYALAYLEALPLNSTFLPGLTFISDTFYDYTNPWHGLSSIVPFAWWHAVNGCATPERWALFHWGELRKDMGEWVRNLAEVSTGGKVREVGELGGEGKGWRKTICFENAVVARSNDGGMSSERKQGVYDLMRCRAREYCGLGRENGRSFAYNPAVSIRMTMFFRVGSRSFKNESAVAGIFERECSKVEGCRAQLVRATNLTFCDQVRLMSETDVLVSPHGAQLTNMIFMDKNSSVMEFFPKGWLELAGAGQYVFQWLADWAGMRHEGQWKDPDGESCPFGDDKAKCFTFHKDRSIGHDEPYFSHWASQVLQSARTRRLLIDGSQPHADCRGQCGSLVD